MRSIHFVHEAAKLQFATAKGLGVKPTFTVQCEIKAMLVQKRFSGDD